MPARRRLVCCALLHIKLLQSRPPRAGSMPWCRREMAQLVGTPLTTTQVTWTDVLPLCAMDKRALENGTPPPVRWQRTTAIDSLGRPCGAQPRLALPSRSPGRAAAKPGRRAAVFGGVSAAAGADRSDDCVAGQRTALQSGERRAGVQKRFGEVRFAAGLEAAVLPRGGHRNYTLARPLQLQCGGNWRVDGLDCLLTPCCARRRAGRRRGCCTELWGGPARAPAAFRPAALPRSRGRLVCRLRRSTRSRARSFRRRRQAAGAV